MWFLCVCLVLVLLILLPFLWQGEKAQHDFITLAGLMILFYGQRQEMAACYMVTTAFFFQESWNLVSFWKILFWKILFMETEFHEVQVIVEI